MLRVVVATHNTHKVDEFRGLLQLPNADFMPLDSGLPVAPETGTTFIENAEQKARFYATLMDNYVIADDSGLRVPLLNGEPGVLSARYAGEHGNDAANNEKLIRRLHEHGVTSAPAEFVCAMSVARHGQILGTVEGVVPGRVFDVPKGTNGFGYDPLFAPSPHPLRFAEMSMEEKSNLSHRAIAVEKLLRKSKEIFSL